MKDETKSHVFNDYMENKYSKKESVLLPPHVKVITKVFNIYDASQTPSIIKCKEKTQKVKGEEKMK